MLEQISKINQTLLDACEAYYVKAEPIMSDAEYDTLEAELRGIVDAHPEYSAYATVLKTVGSDLATGKRVAHIRKMLSIENNYSKDAVVDWCRRFGDGVVFCVESKYDGNSAEFRFKDWQLAQVLTRGTGTEGEDITAQVMALAGIPKSLRSNSPRYVNFPASLNIRGEMIMPDSEFNRINKALIESGQKPYNCARNLAAGTLKQKDLAIVAGRKLTFIPWGMYSEDEKLDAAPTGHGGLPNSHANRMSNLHTYLGFPEHTGILVDKVEDIIPAIDKILALNEKSDIHADGVVIKVDSLALCKELGEGSKFTNWMTCFKPQSLAAETVLREVVWQVGRAGTLTPVAVFDPVVLGGANVERAILNNITWIENLGLKIGSACSVLKSGDIIPQIVKVLDDNGTPIVPPTHCPECNSTLEVRGVSDIVVLQCTNGLCPGRIAAHFSHIGKREYLEIDGLGDEMAGLLVRGEYARNVGELFEFQVESLTRLNKVGDDAFLADARKGGFDATFPKMLRSMENAKSASWERWIAALGIPMIGRTLGKVIATYCKLDSEAMATLPESLLAVSQAVDVEGLGPIKSRILELWASDPGNQKICKTLYECGVRPKSLVRKVDAMVGEPLKGISFVLTGEFSEPREKLTVMLTNLGAVSKSSVSKNVTHLIVGDVPGHSKITKYNELVAKGVNIQKVGKDWLEKALADAGTPLRSDSVAEVEEA
jgi:DNA ligase (NAD+)